MSNTSPLSQKLSNSADVELEWELVRSWATAGEDGPAGPVPDSVLPNTDGPEGSDIFNLLQSPAQLAPKKKTVTQWTCCVCGHTGMSVNIPACQYCSTSRCAYCPVERVRVKAVHLSHGGSEDPLDYRILVP